MKHYIHIIFRFISYYAYHDDSWLSLNIIVITLKVFSVKYTRREHGRKLKNVNKSGSKRYFN